MSKYQLNHQELMRLAEELHEKVSGAGLTEVSDLTRELVEKVTNHVPSEEDDEHSDEVHSVYQQINDKLRKTLGKSETGKILLKELFIKLLVDILFHIFF